MNKKKVGWNGIYDPQMKIAIAREYLISNLSYKELADKYGLRGLTSVTHIMRWYKKNYPDIESKEETKQQPLPATNAELQKALKEANLKVMALEMLIETARKEEGIDLLKKAGTKQSK